MGGARNLKLGKCLFTVRSNDVFVYAKCRPVERVGLGVSCLLYTSDAADE